ncbi:MAG: PIG-L deacetylase family protein [Chloroflexota bacterium]
MALVFAPHFDDETLGCGGLIAHKRQAGQTVKLVFMTDGRLSHSRFMAAAELSAMRKAEAVAAAEKLGISRADIHFLDFVEGRLRQQQPEAIAATVKLLQQWQPAEVFRPFYHDVHPEHLATHEIVDKAAKNWGQTAVCYDYFVWYWHHWPWVTKPLRLRWALQGFGQNTWRYGWAAKQPFSHVYDITAVLSLKNHALQAHRSQMERLQPNWPILSDVANGQFLTCLQQPFEAYHCQRINQ